MDTLIFWGASGFAVVVGLCVIGMIFARLYVRASAERAFVRTGLGGQKVIMSGGAVVLPVFHEVIPINMNTLKLEVSRATKDSLITKDRMRVDVVVAFFVRVKPTAEGVSTAAQTLGQRTLAPENLRALVDDKFVDALRSTAAQMTMQDLQDAREKFVQGVQNTVAEDLTKNGLELESVSLTNFNQTSRDYFDPNNAFDAEGLTKLTQETERRRKERNEVEQDTEVSVREKNRDALAKKLEIEQQEAFLTLEQEQQVKTRTAEQNSRIATFEAQRRQEAEQSRIVAERQVQESEIEREQAVRTRKVEAEREVRVKEIDQSKVTEIAQQEKAIVIAQKSEAQSQAEARANESLAEAVKSEQLVETTRKTAEADRAKQVALIEAAQEAETNAVHITTNARAEREAAQMKAAAMVELAEAARKKGLAEAEAQRALNDAINALSSDQTSLKFRLALLESLPSIIAQTVEPMKAIDGIKIIQVDGLNRTNGSATSESTVSGGTNLAEQAVSAALAYRAHAPLIDSLLGEIGLSGNSLQHMMPGIAASEVLSASPQDQASP
ncbi:flotillin (plasmid) [Burkholderia sp. SFA1]|uniref:flotillin family protein n=2 Tax=unclassified Caballeronia TaxID=2646786 RepID=UPI001F38C213|nr:flotillin family protein [Caballeronia sp. CLC5]MCE4572766.1 flotillin family protein [Caballeronia sp. CLC5]BBQ01858.1 flotillin [Burkholderia sp. SFA1]